MDSNSIALLPPIDINFLGSKVFFSWDNLFIPIVLVAAFWTLAFLLIIRRSFKDQVSAVPVSFLLFNISWEVVYGMIYPIVGFVLRMVVLWHAIDLIMLYQVLRWGPKDYMHLFPPKVFYIYFVLAALGIFGLYIVFANLSNLSFVAVACAQCLLGSVAYVVMLHIRKSVAGQSIYIAICRMIGTPVLVFWIRMMTPWRSIEVYLVTLNFIVDIIYIVLLYRQCMREGINPWTRL